jgi:transcriptional regulator with XRE-family HTH domain
MKFKSRADENADENRGRQPRSTFDAALCQRVAELRKATGMNQVQMAAALGIGYRRYQHFEYYQALPAELILPFADLVGVDVRELLTGGD